LRYEKRQGLEANFVHLFGGNSQVAIFKNKRTKFDRELTFFRMEKSKTQVNKEKESDLFYRSQNQMLSIILTCYLVFPPKHI